MTNQDELKLAVLIDADNASQHDLEVVLSEVATYGTPTVKRAYGDWSKLTGWKDVLLDNGAVPVQQYAYTTGKNATDAAMIIDAMDFLHGGRVGGFVLVSSDSDFTPLAIRLRESGLKVYGVGEQKTPKAFVKACDKFTYVENLRKQIQSSVSEGDLVAKQNASRKEPPPELVEFIAGCIAEASKDDGLCNLSSLGSLLNKKRSDFDTRSYGHAKLASLLKTIRRFEMSSDKHGHPQVRDLQSPCGA